jgi:6,7-dimethyl-8-ribityllumazine synthase
MSTRKASKKPVIHKLSGSKITVCIIVSQWHKDITNDLLKGSLEVFEGNKIDQSSIHIVNVPGSFELPLGAKWAMDTYQPDAVICLGCIIKGETPHFHYISKAVADGIMHLNIANNIPVIFGVLTTDTLKQANQRSGGKHGNKGADASVAALEMIKLRDKLKQTHASKSK